MTDLVNSPSHYALCKDVEAIDVLKAISTREGYLGHLHLTAMAYGIRCEKKANKLEDLKKMKWYLDLLIREIEYEIN